MSAGGVNIACSQVYQNLKGDNMSAVFVVSFQCSQCPESLQLQHHIFHYLEQIAILSYSEEKHFMCVCICSVISSLTSAVVMPQSWKVDSDVHQMWQISALSVFLLIFQIILGVTLWMMDVYV